MLKHVLTRDRFDFMKKNVLMVDDKVCHFLRANKGGKKLNARKFYEFYLSKKIQPEEPRNAANI